MFSTNSVKRFEEKISFFVLFFSWFDHTLQIPNSHYEKKKAQNRQEFTWFE